MRAIIAAPAEGGYRCVERSLPEPKPGELVVALGAAGICRTDLAAARGLMGVAHGRVLGHEASGVVLAGDAALVGRRVTIVPLVPCARCVGCHAEPGAPWACTAPRWLGLDLDGVFVEKLVVPTAQVLVVPEDVGEREAAFVEPLAAALAVLDAPLSGALAIHGDNRIARLIARVLEATGHVAARVTPGDDARYDVVIETTTRDLDDALVALRPGGVLVAKSRPAARPSLDWRLLVHKALRIYGVRYAPFPTALIWLAERRVRVDDLFGPSYPLHAAAAAFARAETDEDLKLFFEPTAPTHPAPAG